MLSDPPRVAGLVLAAGAGARFGGPKGLARTAAGEPWVACAVRALHDGGCTSALVAVGAAADEVAALVPPGATVVRVPDWADGLSATVRAGLAAARGTDAAAVVIVPVDAPDLPAAAVRRVIGAADGRLDAALVQAAYRGAPGHPALLGRAHWDAAAAAMRGDRGAGPYLASHGARMIDCSDLWSGADVDAHEPLGNAQAALPRNPLTGRGADE